MIPVHIIVGPRHGPILALVAGVHGDEYDGILALQDVARELDPAALLGTLIVVPVANSFAFAAAQRCTPEDNVDLNRIFPGRATGSLSERLAWHLCTDLLQQANLIFTLHGGGSWTTLAPWIEFQDVPGPLGQASYEAARASGFPDLIALPKPPGVLLSAMADFGVPLVEGEVGGRGTTRSANVTYYKERVYAVMRHAGILPVREHRQQTEIAPQIWRLCPVMAEATGILLRACDLRQDVRRGDRLGEIIGIDGNRAATVHAPQAGVVGAYREHAGVHTGDPVFILWSRPETHV